MVAASRTLHGRVYGAASVSRLSEYHEGTGTPIDGPQHVTRRVFSSKLAPHVPCSLRHAGVSCARRAGRLHAADRRARGGEIAGGAGDDGGVLRSEEHTSELQSLM